MADWAKKYRAFFVVIVVIVLVFFYLSTISSLLPNQSFVRDDRFHCNLWDGSLFQLVEGSRFIISAGAVDYYYTLFAQENRIFSHYSNDCGGDGCAYLGRLENMKYYGRLNEGPNTNNKPPVALVDSGNVVYACYPASIS